MSIKRILAAAAASAVAVSAMSVAAFAGITNGDANGNYMVDLIATGYNVTDVYGVTFTISGDFAESGVGGGIGFNSPSTGWAQHEWGNPDANKEITLTEDNKVTILLDAPAFAETDTTADDPYAQVWISQWWGNDLTVESAEILGKDGVVLEATVTTPGEENENTGDAPAEGPADETPAETPSETSSETPADNNAPASVDTGVEGVAAILGVAAVAAGAMIVSKKRK